MPQSTNLNKTPYYDDFDSGKNFYKVLFKPGVTVQTRELTTLQSILQNQVEKFGSKFFKNGTVVIPGNSAYIPVYNAVEVETIYKGINVEDYYSVFVGKVLTGSSSGVTAKITKVLSAEDSDRGTTTLYLKYLKSANDFDSETFTAGEELTANFDVELGAGSILSGEPVLQIKNPVGSTPFWVGTAASIEDGVVFTRGYFVDVSAQSIILDQYGKTPSYRVGLTITEKIVDSTDDPSLNDNAQGYSNYAAPGADRFTIDLTLSKKALDDFNDDSFIELFRVENGVIRKLKADTTGSFVSEVLARRTYDESGNYTVRPYDVRAVESLNDRLGNNGVYLDGQKTLQGSIPNESLGLIEVSSGKSYVKGYEITNFDTVLDWNKPRTTQREESSSITFNGGEELRVNNVTSAPKIGLSTSATVALYARRLENNVSAGDTIGYARVYDFEHHNTSYEGVDSEFNLKLFDIQTVTSLFVDSPVTGVPIGAYIQGSQSGAAGYAKSIYDGDTKFNLYQVSGKFIVNESLVVNGISSTSSSIGTVTDYTLNDVKSITDGLGFTADTVLSNTTTINGPFNFVTYHADASIGGIATISRVNGSAFGPTLKVDDVISYQPVGFSSAIFTRVTAFNSTKTEATLVGVTTITDICTGNIGVGTYSVQSVDIIRPTITRPENSELTNKLKDEYIANVDLLNSSVHVKRQSTGLTKSGTTLTLPSLAGTDYVYAAFDEERYVVVNSSDNSIENLTTATLTLTAGGKEGSFTNLSGTSGPCTLISTQIKSNVSQKKKEYTRCTSIILARTKYRSPRNGGLEYNTLYGTYGTRVDDDKLSLNYPDIVEVHAVFEASGTGDPEIPWIAMSDISTPSASTVDFILGERFVGKESGAVGVYIQQKNTTQVYYASKSPNAEKFITGETIEFLESGYQAIVNTITPGDRNILRNYTLDNGQRKNYYDFGRLIRNPGAQEPAGRLRIYFDRFSFDSSDSGDLITTNSYLQSIYGTKIPSYNGVRNTDVIDVRPRVEVFNTLSGFSPFDFVSRSFAGSGANSSQILASNESVVFDYDHYLGRSDKVTLNREGEFSIVYGEPAIRPITPTISEEVLDIATINSTPYTFNIEDEEEVSIVLTDNKRYTMKDLRQIENRVENLEFYTSLNFLEASVENLFIDDGTGLNRFKSGYVVDNFIESGVGAIEDPQYRANFDDEVLSPIISNNRVDLSLVSSDEVITKSELDLTSTNSTNVQLTGTTVTLPYQQVEYTKQPFASRVVSVNPFDIITWVGTLTLKPVKDQWTVWYPTRVNWRRGNNGRRSWSVAYLGQVTYMRSRNINFDATRLKPNTRMKFLFENKVVSGSDAVPPGSVVFPKLLEITDVTGSFQVGETVAAVAANDTVSARFRICTPNHKSGPHNNPKYVYNINPYVPTVGISTLYGPQSTILNVDTESLEMPGLSEFYGNVGTGSRLYGLTSGATAKVSNNRLVTDENGTVQGTLWTGSNLFKTGQTTAKITTQKDPIGVPGEFTSEANAVFTSRGDIYQPTYTIWYDPLAQTFLVEEEEGIVPTSIDIFFADKDEFIPVELQIRETVNGYPGTPDKIVPGLTKVLMPFEVKTSTDASVPTTFTFDNITKLEGGREYALVLVSDSPNYLVWHSRVGEVEISTANNEELGKVIINKQPSMGVMFKAQNGSTWTASQEDDIKFTMRKANFTSNSGTVRLFNSKRVAEVPENLLEENPIYTYSTSADSPLNSGRHIRINHLSHGMQSTSEKVELTGILPDTIPTKLSVGYAVTDTGSISVASTIGFDTYDGSQVNGTNPGYLKISNEIIRYTTVLPGEIANITRAQLGTISLPHAINSEVYKYEFNNVPLSKINTTHTILTNPKPEIDHYYVQVSSGSTFTTDKLGGGENVYASNNANFSRLKLNEDFINSPDGTSVSARVRTVTQRSVDGSESGFVDAGFQTIDPFEMNEFDTLRTVGSKVNEVEFLNSTAFEGQKSLTLELTLNTTNSNISPIVDIDQLFVDLETYRVNQPVGLTSYKSDSRVNSSVDDPHAFAYVTRRINLEQSATSIKAYVATLRGASSDIRMLYKIYRPDVPDEDQTWELFPGYDNLDVNNEVINSDNNSGRSDLNVPISVEDQYREYSFTADDLPPFTSFAIKLLGTTTNEADPPLFRQFRAIALS